MSEITNQDIEKARQGAQNANENWKKEIDRVDELGEEAANVDSSNGEIDWKVEYTTLKTAAIDNLDPETLEILDRSVRLQGGLPIV